MGALRRCVVSALLLILCNGPTVTPQSIVSIPRGATWKYWDRFGISDKVWVTPGFGDGTWPSGAAPLGYGTNALIKTRIASSFITTYYRNKFTATAPSGSAGSVNITGLVADGAIVYINGVEVARFNMPANDSESPTLLASSIITGITYENSRVLALPLSVLAPGSNMVNTIAVSVHQRVTTPVNCIMDVSLITTLFPTPSRTATVSVSPTIPPSRSASPSQSTSLSASPTAMPTPADGIRFTDVWRYKDDGIDMTNVFNKSSTSHSTWKSGRAPFGECRVTRWETADTLPCLTSGLRFPFAASQVLDTAASSRPSRSSRLRQAAR